MRYVLGPGAHSVKRAVSLDKSHAPYTVSVRASHLRASALSERPLHKISVFLVQSRFRILIGGGSRRRWVGGRGMGVGGGAGEDTVGCTTL